MHLSLSQLNRYRLARLAPVELLSLDTHLTNCEFCRQQLRAHLNPAAALFSLRANLQITPEPEHLKVAELTALMNNTLPAVERELATSHLEGCSRCAAQLQLRQKALAEPKPASVLWAWLEAWAERLALVWPMPVAAVLVLVLVALVDHFYVRSKPVPTNVVQQMPTPKPLVMPPVPEPEHKMPVTEPVQIARLQFPAELQSLRGAGITRGSSSTATFQMLRPLGTFVFSPRPTLRWHSLANATSYIVKVFSTDYELIAESPALTTTHWTLLQSLARGKTYIWQVTAQQQGAEVMASSAFAEAKFAVLDRARAQSVAAAKRSTKSPFALGAAYARAGLLDEAEATFQAARKTDPQAATKLLQQVEHARRNPKP